MLVMKFQIVAVVVIIKKKNNKLPVSLSIVYPNSLKLIA